MADLPTSLTQALAARYRIERQLGEGGMATVYLAEDLKHGRPVALKVLKPELAAAVGADRFLAEIRTTANLQHPNILPLFDSGEADGFLYYVMPYVEGESLRERIEREHQLPIEDAVAIATGVAEALDYAHRHDVVHRDIKPGNILLQAGKPVVADFGIALALSAGGVDRVTQTGTSLGTPQYMSPEQAAGDPSVGPASDIYSLGCVLYEMLVGDPPYVGSTPQAILGKVISGTLATPTSQRATVPPNVDAVVRKALERVAADRFMGAREFGEALRQREFRHGESDPRASGSNVWKTAAIAAGGLAAVLAVIALWPMAPDITTAESGDRPFRQWVEPFLQGQHPTGWVDLIPDGSGIVYAAPAPSGVGQQIWLRRWSDVEARPIPGTGGLVLYFRVTPDSERLVFTSQFSDFAGELKSVDLDGGAPRSLGTSTYFTGPIASDGSLYHGGISVDRIPIDGGENDRILTATGSGDFLNLPLALTPDESGLILRRGLGYEDTRDTVDVGVWHLDLDTRVRTLLAPAELLSPIGDSEVVYQVGRSLYASRVDWSVPELVGPSVLLWNDMYRPQVLAGAPVFLSGGDAVLARGPQSEGRYQFFWIDRAGAMAPVNPSEDDLFEPSEPTPVAWRLSPDRTRIAFLRMFDGEYSVWTKRLPDGRFERLANTPGREQFLEWSPDGDSLFFSGHPAGGGSRMLHVTGTDGVGAPRPLWFRDAMARAISSNGEWFMAYDTLTGDYLAIPRGSGGGEPVVMPQGQGGRYLWDPLSPNGAWALLRDADGYWVRRFPETDGTRWPVAGPTARGIRWARNSDELFYVDARTQELHVVEFEAGAEGFRVTGERALFTLPADVRYDQSAPSFDVSPDGQRFLVARFMGNAPETDEITFVYVENFADEVRRLLDGR